MPRQPTRHRINPEGWSVVQRPHPVAVQVEVKEQGRLLIDIVSEHGRCRRFHRQSAPPADFGDPARRQDCVESLRVARQVAFLYRQTPFR
jgi:hypothetical protein